MLYQAFDIMQRSMHTSATLLDMANRAIYNDFNPLSKMPLGRLHSAMLEVSARMMQHYPKQSWGLDTVEVKGKVVPVENTVVLEKPFANLLRFRRKGLPKNAPKALFAAALSGHHATLSRETFKAFLPDHDVYVTDWLDARNVPLSEGEFGLGDYISYLIEFMEEIGPDNHLIGLCQAGVPGLAAAAIMSKDNNPAKPKSMTFMASPMDIRVNPNKLFGLMKNMNMDLMSKLVLQTVPDRFAGAGRKVFPGVFQLNNFMMANLKTHIDSHLQFIKDVCFGNDAAAEKHRDFYDEYFSILDASQGFYRETIEQVFIDQKLPKGEMFYQGKKIDCADITDIPMFTLEGGKDEMVVEGQCKAADDMCTNLPDNLKEYLLQEDVGHYGIFNGSTYQNEIAPRVKAFIKKYN